MSEYEVVPSYGETAPQLCSQSQNKIQKHAPDDVLAI